MAHNTYHAWVCTATGKPLVHQKTEFPEGDLKDGYVEVKVSHCGVCYTDYAFVHNEWGITPPNAVCGHEIVGHVSALGKNVPSLKVGDRVGVSNSLATCMDCQHCHSGNDNLCPKATWAVIRGGFGEYVRAYYGSVFVLPAGLSNEHAAPLMCAGATVYAPLRVFDVSPTARVGVVGIGGLGHIALQIARAWGCEVTALSSTADKEAEARKFGATHFLVTKDAAAALATHKGYFDFIITTAPVVLDYGFYTALLAIGGTLCVAGVPVGEFKLPTHVDFIMRSLKIVGAAGCSRHHYREMLDFCARHGIKPQIEILPFAKINEALEAVKQNKPRYRLVLSHN